MSTATLSALRQYDPADVPPINTQEHHEYMSSLDPETTLATVGYEHGASLRLTPELQAAYSRLTRAQAIRRGGRSYGSYVFLLGCGLSKSEAARILFESGLPPMNSDCNNKRHLLKAATGHDGSIKEDQGYTDGRTFVFNHLTYPGIVGENERAEFFRVDCLEKDYRPSTKRAYFAAYRFPGQAFTTGILFYETNRWIATSKDTGHSEPVFVDRKGREVPKDHVRLLGVLYSLSPASRGWTLEARRGLAFEPDRSMHKNFFFKQTVYWEAFDRFSAVLF